MVKVIKILLFLIAGVSLQAQDIHFTQYQFSPQNLNAANTGRFDGDWRVVGNYRSQWGSILENAFSTTALAYDKQFDILGHHVSGGLQFDYDNAGTGQLTVAKLMGSAAYHKSIGKNKFSLGIQGGWTNKRVDFSQMSLPDQFDMSTGGFESTYTSAESFSNQSFSLFDLSTGIYWSNQINSKWEPEIGFAAHHINTPKESFFNGDNVIEIRNVFNVDVNYQMDSVTVFTPSMMLMGQNKAQEWLLGARVEKYLEKNEMDIRSVFGGVNYRNGLGRNHDAFALILGSKIKKYQVALSYDLNVSGLSDYTNYRGAFEISVIYISERILPNLLNIPCERF